MIVLRSIPRLQKLIQKEKRSGKRISFVPTMGALHSGHLSLITAARRKSDIVAVSIFVNPTQFGPREDYKKYPRPFNRDKKLLEKCGADILFYPDADQMYPEGYSTYVNEERLSKTMCGISRPGHFRGVTTVVLKLFNIVQPDIAFFGQKDYQQALIIKKMVKDLDLPIKIKLMPIIREKDGLAMSSRNQYLSPEERKKAALLYQMLLKRKKIKGIKLDYFVRVDKDTLRLAKKGTLLAIAGWVGKTRLIDNILV